MNGRRPKPLALAEQEGDTRKIGANKLRAKLAAEPKARRGLPGCPLYLKGRARKAYDLWRHELAAMGLDHLPDGQMLEGAAAAYETAVYCYELVEKHGRLLPKQVGIDKPNAEGKILRELVTVGLIPNPAVAMGENAWALMRGFCAEFGLSPVSRTRLAAREPEAPGQSLAALLSAPRSDEEETAGPVN